MIIKILLLASVVAVVIFLVRGSNSGRHLALRRLAMMVFVLAWVAAVLSPGLVSKAANLVGVGRGTDLVLYLVAVAFVFTTVAQHRRIADLDDRLAALVSEMAIHTAAPSDPARDAAGRTETHG